MFLNKHDYHLIKNVTIPTGGQFMPKREASPFIIILLELLMMLPEKERKRWLFNKRRKRLGL
jgi:hypothetical protein